MHFPGYILYHCNHRLMCVDVWSLRINHSFTTTAHFNIPRGCVTASMNFVHWHQLDIWCAFPSWSTKRRNVDLYLKWLENSLEFISRQLTSHMSKIDCNIIRLQKMKWIVHYTPKMSLFWLFSTNINWLIAHGTKTCGSPESFLQYE